MNIAPASRRCLKGFSLLELLLVLGVIAALAIAAFIVYPVVQASNQANAEATNVNTIRAAIQNMYGSTSDYSTLTTSIANQGRVFPTNMNQGDFSSNPVLGITNLWKGEVTVENSTDLPGTHFDITYNDVTPSACAKLTVAMAPNFEVITLNGTVVLDQGNLMGGGVISYNPGTVAGGCTATQNVLVMTAR